jgi:hypothetical protein
MEFKKLVIVFEEDNACRDPYYMGFTFEGKNFALKGQFNKTESVSINDNREIGWGENGRNASKALADLLLMDCLGKKANADLIFKLNASLLNFRNENALAWIVWEDDLKKWINFPKYGILPRLGYLSKFEDEVLTIRFPVPGVTYNQVG